MNRWNKLDDEVIRATSVNAFKNRQRRRRQRDELVVGLQSNQLRTSYQQPVTAVSGILRIYEVGGWRTPKARGSRRQRRRGKWERNIPWKVGSGQSAVLSHQNFFFKFGSSGPFFVQILCSGKSWGIAQCPPLNTPLTGLASGRRSQ